MCVRNRFDEVSSQDAGTARTVAAIAGVVEAYPLRTQGLRPYEDYFLG
jgi:hypothetical protein